MRIQKDHGSIMIASALFQRDNSSDGLFVSQVSSSDNILLDTIFTPLFEVEEEEVEEEEVVKEEVVKEEGVKEEVMIENDTDIIQLHDGSGNSPSLLEWKTNASHKLTQLLIGNNCLQSLTRFELTACPSLEILRIGENCCAKAKGELSIVACSSLKSIQIGSRSFIAWTTLSLNRCEGLESIEMGDECFSNCDSFLLKGEGWIRL